MQRARSVTGPLRRAHPASGATWNVQVVRGKMSSACLWHACRALMAGLLLMLLGAAMATIGYYADTLSVAQEVRGNATVSVKDEARGFHLNNLSYAGPIVMGFGGFIVVAACVMTFEARDSAAKVTPARPQAAPLPARAPRLAAAAGTARWDQLGVYRLPALPLPTLPAHTHRRTHARLRAGVGGGAAALALCRRSPGPGAGTSAARCGSAPDLRAAGRVAAPHALRRPLRRYALSVDEPPQCTHSASAAESECGSQSSLALDLHVGGGCAGGGGAGGVTLRVRDNSRRRGRVLARQSRLREDTQQAAVTSDIRSYSPRRHAASLLHEREEGADGGVAGEAAGERPERACSAPPPRALSASSDTSTVPAATPPHAAEPGATGPHSPSSRATSPRPASPHVAVDLDAVNLYAEVPHGASPEAASPEVASSPHVVSPHAVSHHHAVSPRAGSPSAVEISAVVVLETADTHVTIEEDEP